MIIEVERATNLLTIGVLKVAYTIKIIVGIIKIDLIAQPKPSKAPKYKAWLMSEFSINLKVNKMHNKEMATINPSDVIGAVALTTVPVKQIVKAQKNAGLAAINLLAISKEAKAIIKPDIHGTILDEKCESPNILIGRARSSKNHPP